MIKRTIEFDGPSGRFWVNGTQLLPRNREEAQRIGLQFDHATNAWWSGDRLVARQSEIDRCRVELNHGLIRVFGWEED